MALTVTRASFSDCVRADTEGCITTNKRPRESVPGGGHSMCKGPEVRGKMNHLGHCNQAGEEQRMGRGSHVAGKGPDCDAGRNSTGCGGGGILDGSSGSVEIPRPCQGG